MSNDRGRRRRDDDYDDDRDDRYRDRYDDRDDDYDRPRGRRPYADQESTGFAVASLVLGILSVVLFCIWFVSIPCGILAIIFGTIDRSRSGKGMAIAGLTMGVIGVGITLLIILGAVGRVNFWRW